MDLVDVGVSILALVFIVIYVWHDHAFDDVHEWFSKLRRKYGRRK